MSVVEGKVDLVFCYVGGDMDGEVVGYRREDDDGANEDSSEEAEEDVHSPSSKHEGREGEREGRKEGEGRESERERRAVCMRS